ARSARLDRALALALRVTLARDLAARAARLELAGGDGGAALAEALREEVDVGVALRGIDLDGELRLTVRLDRGRDLGRDGLADLLRALAPLRLGLEVRLGHAEVLAERAARRDEADLDVDRELLQVSSCREEALDLALDRRAARDLELREVARVHLVAAAG